MSLTFYRLLQLTPKLNLCFWCSKRSAKLSTCMTISLGDSRLTPSSLWSLQSPEICQIKAQASFWTKSHSIMVSITSTVGILSAKGSHHLRWACLGRFSILSTRWTQRTTWAARAPRLRRCRTCSGVCIWRWISLKRGPTFTSSSNCIHFFDIITLYYKVAWGKWENLCLRLFYEL